MKNLKQILLSFPEYYFVVLALLSGYTPPFYINPIFIGIALILILQIIFKNKIVGIAIAAQLLFVGLALFIFNIFTWGVMIYKLQLKGEKPNQLPN